ncbi:MAG: hypothetical protein MJ060_03545 [Clostridia bacterium]|nr:hypothetical protein [Clostridia bacterium]
MKGFIKTKEEVERDLIAVKEYYASKGFNDNVINKLVKNGMRDIDLIQIRIEDYQELWHIDEKTVWATVLKNPKLLGYETKGKHISTSIESKMLDWQNTFHLDKPTLIQMILNRPQMLNAGRLQDMIADYQKVLQVDQATVKKMILQATRLAEFNIDNNIVKTLKFYRDTLQIDQHTLNQMILQYPPMLGFDITESPTSVKSKIEKLNEVMPFKELRARVIEHPRILGAPANAFKLRYMLAMLADHYAGPDYDVINVFFQKGFMTEQNKVWALLCYLKSKNLKTMSHLRATEERINKRLGVKTEDLKQQYPLDAQALNQIEQEFLQITHRLFDFNQQELAEMHMTRDAAGAVIPDDTRSL